MATWMPSYSTTTGTIPATWTQWVNTYTASSTANQYHYVTNTTTGATTVWDQWRDVGYIQEPVQWQQEVWGEWVEDDRRMEEMAAERRRQRDEMQRRAEERSREQLAARQAEQERIEQASARGRELLELVVAAEDRVPGLDILQFEGSDGHLYRVEMHRRTVHGNIVRIDEHGCMLGRACVAPEMYDGIRVLPTEDGWVGQYLGLKFDAETFLARANWSGRQRCREELQVAA